MSTETAEKPKQQTWYQKKIAELEAEVKRLEAAQIVQGITADGVAASTRMTATQAVEWGQQPYNLAVWQCTRDTKTEKGLGEPMRWRHHHATEDEWLYHERLNFCFDSGYGSFVLERCAAMVANAFGGIPKSDGTGVNVPLQIERLGPLVKGDQAYQKLPPFHKDNVIEVIVRIRKGG